jgi:hypothetical protein
MNYVYNRFQSKKNTCYIVGAPRVLGLKEYWGVEWIILTNHALNLCLVSKINHVEVVELVYVGILLLGMNYHFPWNNMVIAREKIEMRDWSLWSIELK